VKPDLAPFSYHGRRGYEGRHRDQILSEAHVDERDRGVWSQPVGEKSHQGQGDKDRQENVELVLAGEKESFFEKAKDIHRRFILTLYSCLARSSISHLQNQEIYSTLGHHDIHRDYQRT